jgi:hypothetical protein
MKHHEQQNRSQLRTHVRALARILAPSVDDIQYPDCDSESEEGGKKFKSARLVLLTILVAMRGVPYYEDALTKIEQKQSYTHIRP